MASLTDKITDVRNGSRPGTATVTVARSIAGTVLSCNDLSGWPTDSKVHFVTYQIDTNNDPIAGTQLDCSGIVSGSTITQLTVHDGTDGGSSIGDIVEMLPTAMWAQDLADALTESHERDGTLKDDIVTTAKILNSAVTTAKLAGSITSDKIIGISKSTLTTDSNPYKFCAYQAGDLSIPSGVATLVSLDTELFDTNSDFNTSTYSYVAPVTGFYQINAQVGLTAAGASAGCAMVAYMLVNNVAVVNSTIYVGSGSANSVPRATLSKLISLTAGDAITLKGQVNEAGRHITGNSATTFMSGFLVSRT